MNKIKNLSIVLLVVPFMLVSVTLASAEMTERERVLNSKSVANFKDSVKIKKNTTVNLTVYSGTVMTAGNRRSLSFVCDEIWEVVDNAIFTEAEKKKWKGQFDICKAYWKDGKILAMTVEKFYKTTGKHEVTDIYDREFVLKEVL